MMIEGVGPATTTVDAGGLSRVLNVPAAANPASISGLTIRNGKVAGSNVVLGQGAGIQNAGSPNPAQRRDQRQHRAARWRNRGDRERRRHLQLRRTVDLRERDRRQPGHHPATQRRHCLRRRHLQPRVPADGGTHPSFATPRAPRRFQPVEPSTRSARLRTEGSPNSPGCDSKATKRSTTRPEASRKPPGIWSFRTNLTVRRKLVYLELRGRRLDRAGVGDRHHPRRRHDDRTEPRRRRSRRRLQGSARGPFRSAASQPSTCGES